MTNLYNETRKRVAEILEHEGAGLVGDVGAGRSGGKMKGKKGAGFSGGTTKKKRVVKKNPELLTKMHAGASMYREFYQNMKAENPLSTKKQIDAIWKEHKKQ